MAAQIDLFPGIEDVPGEYYGHGAAVTPNDSTPLATLPRALMATTTAGVVTVVSSRGDTFNIYLPLGVPVRVRASIVKSTGAVAAGIVALW